MKLLSRFILTPVGSGTNHVNDSTLTEQTRLIYSPGQIFSIEVGEIFAVISSNLLKMKTTITMRCELSKLLMVYHSSLMLLAIYQEQHIIID